MFKETLIALFVFLAFSFPAAAQTSRGSNLIRWEHLEVSGTKYSGGYRRTTRYYRDYNFLTSASAFPGPNSLEWIKDSGWELVSVVNNGESSVSLFFKRPLNNKFRTESEIARLKQIYEAEFNSSPKAVLIDLDEREFKQSLTDFNRKEEVRARAALERIKSPPLKIISLVSNSSRLGTPSFGAEVVLDATKILLKDGNAYRSSDAEKLFQETARQITEALKLNTDVNFSGSAQNISKGSVKPEEIGKFKDFFNEINIRFSMTITVNNNTEIIAQDTLYGPRVKEK